MSTRLEKARINVRKDEGVLTPFGSLIPTEMLGAKTNTDDTRLNLPQGSAVISPKSIREAKKIERRQGPEVKKWTAVLKDLNTTTLAKRTAERRLKTLKSAYDPILMAEASARRSMGGATTNPDGSTNAWVGALLSALPAAYNVINGMNEDKKDRLNSAEFQNSYETQVRSLMSNRRFNVDPSLRANEESTATANYNLRNIGGGGGFYTANLTAIQNAKMKADAQTYTTKQNQDNQYMQEQAVLDTNLGQQRANRNLEINQMNQQASAAKREILGTGLGQISQFAQNQQLMSNQKSRDDQMMSMYQSWMDMMSGKPGKSSILNSGKSLSAPLSISNTVMNGASKIPSLFSDYTVDPTYAWQMQGRSLVDINQ